MDLIDAIAAATLAPSPHNTQPWIWRIRAEAVDLFADRSRTLSVCDPDGRELAIGCGAALEQLLLVLANSRTPMYLQVLPDPNDDDHFARVVTGTGEPYPARPELVDAMPQRHTNRTHYRSDPLPPETLNSLAQAVERFGVHITRVDDPNDRDAVTDMIMAGDRDQMNDVAFRKELSSWIRPADTSANDGMPANLLGQHGIAAEIAPLAVRTFDVGKGQAAKDRQLTNGSPVIWVLHTDADDQAAWLATGRALAHLTLQATADGIAHAYMNQPCEVPHLRRMLADQLDITGHPQLIVRMGYADQVPASPRRPVVDVIR